MTRVNTSEKTKKPWEPETYRIAKTITIGVFTVIPDDVTECYAYRAISEQDYQKLLKLARKPK